jgi:hypothetical protein
VITPTAFNCLGRQVRRQDGRRKTTAELAGVIITQVLQGHVIAENGRDGKSKGRLLLCWAQGPQVDVTTEISKSVAPSALSLLGSSFLLAA